MKTVKLVTMTLSLMPLLLTSAAAQASCFINILGGCAQKTVQVNTWFLDTDSKAQTDAVQCIARAKYYQATCNGVTITGQTSSTVQTLTDTTTIVRTTYYASSPTAPITPAPATLTYVQSIYYKGTGWRGIDYDVLTVRDNTSKKAAIYGVTQSALEIP